MGEITKIPTHVSIVMDGNGRWAKERGEERLRGHFEGVESIRACVEECVRLGIRYISLFAFSEENWNRSEHEVTGLMKLIFNSMEKEMHLFIGQNVRLRVLGNRDRLPDELNGEIDKIEAMTKNNDVLDMILFISYSGQWDILQAARRFAADAAADPSLLETAGADTFSKYLVTAGIPDPDLIIRTSGEMRLSNYLLWQAAYSEYYFTDTLWPDFRKEEFHKALEEYSRRDRRYGKV
ncbi:MAG: di-trans,poly-cis-decaprenylcistransferase [Bacteroidales bacterium]|nr:di-trans,poly-cis-decaprenylcistransferase [Bacteroidales bacterium]